MLLRTFLYYQSVGILDLIFPKTCLNCGSWGSYLCLKCQGEIIYLERQFCPECNKPSIGGYTHPKCHKKQSLDGLLALTYYQPPVTKLIQALKYNYTTALLEELISKVTLDKKLFPDINFELIPVPMHQKRQNWRGFNQSHLLGKAYAQKLLLKLNDKLVLKEKETKPQVGLKRVERLKNLDGSFVLTGEVADKNYLIFDDVWTTGSTLKSIATILKKNGADQVWGFTLARSR